MAAFKTSSGKETLWCFSYSLRKPCRILKVSSLLGALTVTWLNRRDKAASFKIVLRYSSWVVAPIKVTSPRERAGFKISAIPLEPEASPAFPAPMIW